MACSKSASVAKPVSKSTGPKLGTGDEFRDNSVHGEHLREGRSQATDHSCWSAYYFSGGVEAAPGATAAAGTLVTWKSGIALCAVLYTPQLKGRITTSQYTPTSNCDEPPWAAVGESGEVAIG